MTSIFQVQLNTSCILKIPYNTYDDFTFKINGESFKTNRIVADLISSEVCKIHSFDPTFREMTITTKNKGNFLNYLNLSKFDILDIPEEEIPFFSEIVEKLGRTFDLSITHQLPDLTTENVFSLLQKHEKYGNLYSTIIDKEIDFISSHFYQLCNEENVEEFKKINVSTIEKIINNPKIQLKNEDQLLSLVNDLYLFGKDCSFVKDYSILYEYVCFQNVQQDQISIFLEIFDINDITKATWTALSKRLSQNNQNDSEIDRYKKYENIDCSYQSNKQFNGIINFLLLKSNMNIDENIAITSLSVDHDHYPSNVTLFEDNQKYFYSLNINNQWLCFDFKKHKIIPKYYQIKSQNSSCNLKSWIIEGSNDNSNWETLDEKNNRNELKKNYQIRAFEISKPTSNSYQFVRIRQLSNWNDNNILTLSSFEFYGTLLYNII